MPAQQRRFGQQALYQECTLELVREVLRTSEGNQSESCAEIIRSIVLRNIARKRVSGLIANDKNSDVRDWLTTHIRHVHANYQSQMNEWRALRNSHLRDDLHKRLEALALECLRRHWLQALTVDFDELVDETFATVLETSDEYPFHVSIQEWLDDEMVKCLYTLDQPLPKGIRVFSLDEERDQGETLGDGLYAFENNPEAVDGEIDLARFREHLAGPDRRLFDLKLAAYTRQEIAAKLNLSPKTVSNRLTIIRALLQARDAI